MKHSVILLAWILLGCAERHVRPQLPDVYIPQAEVTLHRCEIRFDPPRCHGTTVKYKHGTEQVVAAK